MIGHLWRVSRLSLLARAAILGAAMVLVMAVSLPVGYALLPTRASIAAGGLAGGICLLSGWLALYLSEKLRRPQQVLALVAVGAIVRAGIVLSASVALYLVGGPLAGAGVLYYLIAFYLVALTIEIALILPSKEPNEKPGPERRKLSG